MNYLTNWRVSFSILSSIGVLIVTATSARAVDPNVWEASINPQTKERFIPVELWTGADWNGQKELKIAPVDGTYRHRTSTYHQRACRVETSRDRRDFRRFRTPQPRQKQG